MTVRRVIPGVTGPPASTATLTFPGITDAARAEAECALQAARQVYHRRRVSWEMGPRGARHRAWGDVVVLSHGLLDGGEAGRASGNGEPDGDGHRPRHRDRPGATGSSSAPPRARSTNAPSTRSTTTMKGPGSRSRNGPYRDPWCRSGSVGRHRHHRRRSQSRRRRWAGGRGIQAGDGGPGGP